MNRGDTRRRHSIVIRSSGVTLVFVLAHGLGYVMMLAANYLLDAAAFGVFYTAWVALTVLMAPATAILMVLGRVLADAAVTLGRAAVARLTLQLLRRCLWWGVPAALCVGLVLVGIGALAGSDSWRILLLIPLTTLVLIVVEVLRTSFQALLLFGWSSALLVASQTAQLALGLPAMAITRRVWPSFLGVLVAAALACGSFVPWFVREARRDRGTAHQRLPLSLGRETRLVASYSLFVLITNMDILVGYGLLSRGALSVYAASALLPKAIVLATLPVAQIVLPVIVEQNADGRPTRHAGLTALALVLAMGASASAVLWLILPVMQTTPLAVRGLDIGATRVLALGAVGLGAARVLVVAEIALGRHAIGYVQGGAVAIFGILASTAGHLPWPLAVIYTGVCWLFFFAAAAILGAGFIRPPARRAQ